MATLRLGAVDVSLYTSPLDGSIVVQIDTDAAGSLRVNVNDGPIWNADPETHHHTDCSCVTDWKHHRR